MILIEASFLHCCVSTLRVSSSRSIDFEQNEEQFSIHILKSASTTQLDSSLHGRTNQKNRIGIKVRNTPVSEASIANRWRCKEIWEDYDEPDLVIKLKQKHMSHVDVVWTLWNLHIYVLCRIPIYNEL
ncbi:unnamed protein product [Lathyrus oleraceus]